MFPAAVRFPTKTPRGCRIGESQQAMIISWTALLPTDEAIPVLLEGPQRDEES